MPVNPVSNQWTNAFVPETSDWDNKPLCVDEFDENPNCCASGYDIEAVLEQAYEDGLNEHPGVKALEGRPCIHSADLETLADDLATMSTSEEVKPVIHNDSNLPDNPGGIPENLNPNARTDVIFDKKILNYCADLVNRVTTASYGGKAEVPEIKTLGSKFNDVFRFCAYAITERVSIIDVLQNKYQNKKQMIESSFIPFSTRGLENKDSW